MISLVPDRPVLEDPFAGAKAARIRPGDMALLMKVSRVTVSLWYNGHAQPHRLLAGRATKILAAIDAALQAGDFPVPEDTARRDRSLYVSTVVTRYVKRLAEK